MLSGHFAQLFELLSRGVSPLMLCKFIMYQLPNMLRFSVPLSILITTVLVFSRLSADNEIVAMKAIGISIWQIITPSLVLSAIAAGLSLWVSLFVAPGWRYKAEQLRWSAVAETPLALLNAGTFTEIIPHCSIRIGSRNGDELQDIHIQMQDSDDKNKQDIFAKSGKIIVNTEEEVIEIALKEANITSYRLDEKPSSENVRFLSASSITLPINIVSSGARSKITRKVKYMDLRMLCAKIATDKAAGEDITRALVEIHSNLALAISPFSFFLLGLPFGIRSKRSELSIGLLICLILALVFYAFIMLADTLKDISSIHPQYIIWVPNLIYQAVGIIMIKKLEHRG